MDKYLLGLDVGTTGTKAILFSVSGEVVAQAYQGYPTQMPQVEFREQSPEDWWQAVCQVTKAVCAGKEEKVAALSLSTQGGTMVAVDKEMKPLRPAIVWNDVRAEEECREFLEQVGPANLMYRKTGWELHPSASSANVRWIRKHQPEIFEKLAMYLSVPDYIAMKMTGRPAVDISNVGINRFADIQKAEYDAALLAFSGLHAQQLAEIVPSGTFLGRLTEKAAKEMGLTTNTAVVSGAHDQYAVALGAGAYNAGDILIGSGTCWVVTGIGDQPAFETGLAQSVAAVPGQWGSLCSLPSGGICLEWLRKNFGNDIPYEQINKETAVRKAAEEGLFFYPFSGFAENDKQFTRGSFLGLDLSHDTFHLTRAVMEGVVFQIVGILEKFPAEFQPKELILSGGASKSPVWSQILADIADLPVRIPETADLGCVGAAILAGVGSGIYTSAEAGYESLAVKSKLVMPNPEQVAKYAPLKKQYAENAVKLTQIYKL